jgi:2-dehydro-3-deoxyglucarate aldolase/4-hydroxy-2-oxoheptanedioate aldolase
MSPVGARRNPVARELRQGGSAFGTFALEFVTAGLPRTAASAGAEFIVLDQEHSGLTSETLRTVLAAARASDIVPIVRVPAVDAHAISVALDLGALGVMAPRVDSADEARAVVSAARYPPVGRRGFGILHVDEHGGDVERYMREVNEEILVIVQIESADAIRSVDAIAAVDGVDALWIGQYDLTASLGIPGRFEDPSFLEALAALVTACEQHGKAPAMATDSVEAGRQLLMKGFRCIAIGHDLTLYRVALEQGLQGLRAEAGTAS